MGDDAFYVQSGDSEAIGPVTAELLVEGVRRGRVPVSAKVCAVGASEWTPLATHRLFAAVVREVAPPPPPQEEAQAAAAASTSDGIWEVWYPPTADRDWYIDGPLNTKEVIAEIVRGRVGVSSKFRAVGSATWEPIYTDSTFRAVFDHLGKTDPHEAQHTVAAWSPRPAPYRPHDSEDERRRAARGFTTRAVITLLLYWLFWLPGLIANIAYLSEASAEQKVTGRAPEGKGCLVSLLFVFVGLPVLVVLLEVLLVASAATSAPPVAKTVVDEPFRPAATSIGTACITFATAACERQAACDTFEGLELAAGRSTCSREARASCILAQNKDPNFWTSCATKIATWSCSTWEDAPLYGESQCNLALEVPSGRGVATKPPPVPTDATGGSATATAVNGGTPTAPGLTGGSDAGVLPGATGSSLRGTGQLSVVGACDAIYDNGNSLGPCPLDGSAVPVGPHTLELVWNTPHFSKFVSVEIVEAQRTRVDAGMPTAVDAVPSGVRSSAAAVPGTPQKPAAGQVAGAIGAVLPAARHCLDSGNPVSRATIVFQSDGTVQSVAVSGFGAGTEVEACIRATLAKATVPPFTDASFSFPVTVRGSD